MLEIVLTREDANTEFALLAEWLVEDRDEVTAGQPVCVVETTKATVEIESPGDGTLVRLFADGVEVELGRTIALVAQSVAELESALARREPAIAAETQPGDSKATKKAIALAERHGIDLGTIEKRGFITEKDVEAAIAGQTAAAGPSGRPVLAGLSTEGVSLPASFELEGGAGALEAGFLEAGFLESLRSDSERFRTLGSAEKLEQYREHGAAIGDDIVLGPGAIVVAPRIVLEQGVELDAGTTIWCEDVVAIGALTRFGANAELRCRRAFLGSNVWVGRSARFGGGGHRDPWAVLTIGDLAYIGDEAYVNVCRPVVIGREAFVTMRSLIITHNIGHSLLEGFENRFAPVVLEDRAQVGLGAVIYAGCRIGSEAIVASNSYVVADVPAGAFAIGVPAKVTGSATHHLSRSRQVELARRMIDELHELLALRGHDVSAIEEGDVRRFEVRTADGAAHVLFTPSFRGADKLDGATEAVVLTLESSSGELPDGTAVLDLLARRIDGSGGVVLESVREFCRKRGIRFEPGPWRYRGGLV